MPKRIEPGPGQESVWDYPRPPRLERERERIRVVFAGETLIDTRAAWRVLETSHPPTYYVPRADVAPGALVAAGGGSVCEWKGPASYFNIVFQGRRALRAAWTYEDPVARFAPIMGHVAVYAAPMDECWVGDERATPQPGDFYGGWVTPRIVGPFKGVPGSWGW